MGEAGGWREGQVRQGADDDGAAQAIEGVGDRLEVAGEGPRLGAAPKVVAADEQRADGGADGERGGQLVQAHAGGGPAVATKVSQRGVGTDGPHVREQAIDVARAGGDAEARASGVSQGGVGPGHRSRSVGRDEDGASARAYAGAW
jgi:hypothetical protein